MSSKKYIIVNNLLHDALFDDMSLCAPSIEQGKLAKLIDQSRHTTGFPVNPPASLRREFLSASPGRVEPVLNVLRNGFGVHGAQMKTGRDSLRELSHRRAPDHVP